MMKLRHYTKFILNFSEKKYEDIFKCEKIEEFNEIENEILKNKNILLKKTFPTLNIFFKNLMKFINTIQKFCTPHLKLYEITIPEETNMHYHSDGLSSLDFYRLLNNFFNFDPDQKKEEIKLDLYVSDNFTKSIINTQIEELNKKKELTNSKEKSKEMLEKILFFEYFAILKISLFAGYKIQNLYKKQILPHLLCCLGDHKVENIYIEEDDSEIMPPQYTKNRPIFNRMDMFNVFYPISQIKKLFKNLFPWGYVFKREKKYIFFSHNGLLALNSSESNGNPICSNYAQSYYLSENSLLSQKKICDIFKEYEKKNIANIEKSL